MVHRSIVVAAMYKFVALDNFRELRDPLLDFCLQPGIKGTLLLAHEGINGTVAGTREQIDALLVYLRADPRLADIEHKESLDEVQPFYRMKVKLKKEPYPVILKQQKILFQRAWAISEQRLIKKYIQFIGI